MQILRAFEMHTTRSNDERVYIKRNDTPPAIVLSIRLEFLFGFSHFFFITRFRLLRLDTFTIHANVRHF